MIINHIDVSRDLCIIHVRFTNIKINTPFGVTAVNNNYFGVICVLVVKMKSILIMNYDLVFVKYFLNTDCFGRLENTSTSLVNAMTRRHREFD